MWEMHHSSITVINSLLLLITITTSMKSDLESTPIICNQTDPWKLGGRDIVADSKGFVLLVALMPMQCEHCHKQLMKFQAVTEKLPEIRIVVVAPYNENPRLIERYREEFPRVAIGMETTNERVWNLLSGSAHDHFIYDRCGRLISIIRHPRSDTSKFEDTLEALKLAVGYAQCGWCQYDPPDLPAPPIPVIPTSGNSGRKSKTKTPRIKAIVQPQAFVEHRPSTVSSDRRSSNASNDKRSYLRTNTVATAHETRSRTSNVYIPSVSPIALSAAANNNQQQTITTNELQQQQQQQREEAAQPGRLKFGTEQQHQRRVVIRPDKDLSKTNNWRASKGWTVSRKFPSRIHQDKGQEFEQTYEQSQMRQKQQQQGKERRYQQEQERKKQREQEQRRQQKQGHDWITEQRQAQQEQERIQKQQEENRRIQEQQRLQEEGRQRKEQERQEQQRLQQLEYERRMEEQRRLQERQQRTEGDLYTDDDDDKREPQQSNRQHEENLKPSVMQLHQQHAQQAQDATMTRESFSPSKPFVKIPSLYDEDEGDYDYSQMISETTTVIPTERTQIPGTEPPGVWPTPFLFEQQVPCNAFTDKVCLQQKKTVGADKMNKCCNKGIYLTDLCMPETCTNVTTDLCCMQKFLQSKYRCCRNDSKAINSPGDAFSRCCYQNFVQDDDKCCPAKRAKFHWASAYEVCLPNVQVDLSDLRFSVHLIGKGQGDSDAITINLNEERSWNHKCEQGSSVIQFPYLPEDEESGEGGGENAEEGR